MIYDEIYRIGIYDTVACKDNNVQIDHGVIFSGMFGIIT